MDKNTTRKYLPLLISYFFEPSSSFLIENQFFQLKIFGQLLLTANIINLLMHESFPKELTESLPQNEKLSSSDCAEVDELFECSWQFYCVYA